MSNDLADIAARNGFSQSAATVAFDALRHGRGMAQFNHSELGGYGQWMNGMVMISSMNDHSLKARVAALFVDLLPWATEQSITEDQMEPMKPMQPMRTMEPMKPMSPMEPIPGSRMEAPEDWGRPAASGGQNSIRYAYFPRPRRLVVERDGKRTVYDTADHDITGVSQDQSNVRAGRMVFTSQDGSVTLDSMKVIKDASADPAKQR
jgi:hypothetical protein